MLVQMKKSDDLGTIRQPALRLLVMHNGDIAVLHRLSNKTWRILAPLFGVLASFAIISGPAKPEGFHFISEEDALGLITTVNIEVSDQVSDGCWTNASRVAATLRLLFEQNDVVVELDPLAFFSVPARIVRATVVGYRIGGICVGNAQFVVEYWSSTKIGGFNGGAEFFVSGVNTSAESSTVFANSTNLNQQLSSFFEEKAMSLVADIISARRSSSVISFKAAYPAYGTNVLTQIEWDRILSSQEKNQ